MAVFLYNSYWRTWNRVLHQVVHLGHEDPFALQAATHARFFLESTVIPAVFPGLAEYSARFGDVIYSFDEA